MGGRTGESSGERSNEVRTSSVSRSRGIWGKRRREEGGLGTSTIVTVVVLMKLACSEIYTNITNC